MPKPRQRLARNGARQDASLAVWVNAELLEHARDLVAYGRTHGRADVPRSLRDLVERGVAIAIARAEKAATSGRRVPRRRSDILGRPASLETT